MLVKYENKKIEDICFDKRKMVQKLGQRQSKKLTQRLNEIKASDNLAILSMLPAPRCHQLKGKRDNQFAVDLVHPFRLIFEPYHDPMPLKSDGGFDLSKITTILIIEVVDYHD
ncbi:type II toxin-antitoxin system RelE/ParE family toxin [Sporolactobacillus inulinus]|jgi:proteic killer suppression protein|uniref:Killer suppression protein HigA n=1 Tax=Sporolactobacillus inulinus CASD TaxID=1069536 RepID=A0A0U1QSI3_9BACL|nr:type II toxin-antitoxin system RelE/ParE family toxin [Sporolactobacillus inulinus]KLI03758.1 killer suppression protein HigA [Sporolactobacillus inulinus CASD]GEB78553.1 hypothetical protein SIN01_28980 [Sporolactobacillus inulinus]